MKSRLNWTAQEDQILKELRGQSQTLSWDEIANKLFQITKLRLRTGKQCRERYVNFSKFTSQTNITQPWSQQQVELLFQNYLIIGPKWMQISKKFKEKSANSVKNKFYGTIRRLARHINCAMKARSIKFNKPLNQKSFITILNYRIKQLNEGDEQIKKLQQFIYEELIKSKEELQEDKKGELSNIGLQIRKFNDRKRFQAVNTGSERSKDYESKVKIEQALSQNLSFYGSSLIHKLQENCQKINKQESKIQACNKQEGNELINLDKNVGLPQMQLLDDENMFKIYDNNFRDLDQEIRDIFNSEYQDEILAFSK